jgi:hypothetical protein
MIHLRVSPNVAGKQHYHHFGFFMLHHIARKSRVRFIDTLIENEQPSWGAFYEEVTFVDSRFGNQPRAV